MHSLRTHIARIIVAVLVWTGFSLYMVQPVHADHSSQSFANWLTKMANSSDSADLQKELNNLRESPGQLENTIKEASQIVSRNNANFDFSFSESMASQHLYQLLLIEWSQSQAENAMAGTPAKHISKLHVSATIDKLGPGNFVPGTIASSDASFLVNNQFFDGQELFKVVLEPMVDSIAIGAP